ncbi:MAG: branched-chain amino acid ABC transporter permease, partial [Tabrizicola sp.]|nr:branched-chain amino acid ABC transporter permease [Tabrizicola sp.]
MNGRNLLLFGIVALLYIATGFFQSWNLAFSILNAALLATIAALGVNMQWGYAGLFSTGVMGFTALGGLAVVLVSARPVAEGWAAGGAGVLMGLLTGAATIAAAIFAYNRLPRGRLRGLVVAALLIGGFFLYRAVFDPAATAVEAFNPA